MIGVTEVKHVSGAGLNARGLHAHFGAVRAEVTLVGDVVIVAADGRIRAGGLALAGVFAAVGINADDASGVMVDGVVWASFKAGRVFALHAERGQEIAGDFGVGAMLPVINFGAIAAERDVVFDFAGDGAGVTADAALNV